jgi:hypothetical protein
VGGCGLSTCEGSREELKLEPSDRRVDWREDSEASVSAEGGVDGALERRRESRDKFAADWDLSSSSSEERGLGGGGSEGGGDAGRRLERRNFEGVLDDVRGGRDAGGVEGC